jgi:predicted DNA-binding transcriptional regulator AlpA
VPADELAGIVEVAEILGVTRATANKYAARPDFPEPVGQLARGRVWRRADVEAWGKANLPLPTGRPPKK